MKMFAVIYRAYTKKEKETEFQTLWHQVATYFKEHRGALGSALHKTEEGYWLAYSRWPDKATRDASWVSGNFPSTRLPIEIQKAILGIKECIASEQHFPEICMELVEDLMFNPKN
jgi:quinol monooxygenase YgiN